MFNYLLDTLLPSQTSSETLQIITSAIVSIASTDEHKELLKEWVVAGKPFYMKDGQKVGELSFTY